MSLDDELYNYLVLRASNRPSPNVLSNPSFEFANSWEFELQKVKGLYTIVSRFNNKGLGFSASIEDMFERFGKYKRQDALDAIEYSSRIARIYLTVIEHFNSYSVDEDHKEEYPNCEIICTTTPKMFEVNAIDTDGNVMFITKRQKKAANEAFDSLKRIIDLHLEKVKRATLFLTKFQELEDGFYKTKESYYEKSKTHQDG